MTNSIYPNLVGGVNPVGLIRNLTQPLTKTLPEMGYWNPVKVGKAYYNAVKTIASPKAIRELEAKGILPADVGDMISVKPETLTGAGGKLYEGVESFNKVMMSMFNKTDTINRIVTAQLSDDLVNEMIKGSSAGRKAISRLPARLRDEAGSIFGSTKRVDVETRLPSGKIVKKPHTFDSSNPQAIAEFKRKLSNHYAVQTQLAYGITGNSELVRDGGRIISMLSKWPTQVGSDMHAHALQKEWGRLASKYGAPWAMATAGAMFAANDGEEETPVTDFLVGQKRGADWTGANAVISLNLTPPIISGILGTGVGAADLALGIAGDDEGKARSGAKAVGRGITQFVPVLGAAWAAQGRLQRAFGSQEFGRSENILLPEEMEFDY